MATPSSASAGAPAVPAAPTLHGRGVAMTDWDPMFEAVKLRLRRVAALPVPANPLAALAQAQADIFDCLSALDQLHLTLRQEFGRRQRIERDAAGPFGADRPANAMPNGRFFLDRLGLALARAAPQLPELVVMFVELDGLPVLDPPRLGRSSIEKLLQILAARVTRALRQSDTVSRMGDAQFACLIDGAWKRESLSQLACRLFDALSAPLTVDHADHALRPSIGIASCPQDGVTHDGLLQAASAAMYRAKGNQLGYAFYESDPAT